MMKSKGAWHQPLTRWFWRKPASVVGIDLGTETLKVAEVIYRQQGPTLNAVGVVNLPEQIMRDGRIADGALAAETLRNALNSSGVTGKDAVAAVGGRSLFIREVYFPVMAQQELPEAVKWEIEKYLPGATEQYYFDFAVAEPEKTGDRMKVLLVAAPRERVAALTKLLQDAGMRNWGIDVEPLAYLRTLDHGSNKLLVEIGSETSRMIAFHNNSPALHRLVSIGGRHLLQGGNGRQYRLRSESAVNELAREIHLTLEFFRNQGFELEMQDLLFAGGGASSNSFMEQLGHLLGGWQLQTQQLPAALSVAFSLDKDALAAITPQISAAVGLALSAGLYYDN